MQSLAIVVRLLLCPAHRFTQKTDGVVHWRGSLQNIGEEAENVEVWASHTGLGFNPSVMVLIADRLRQDPVHWQPFVPKGWDRVIFPRPAIRAE